MSPGKSLVKIGQLARLAEILPSKIRYYVQEGLLKPVDRTRGGYYLFDEPQALSRLKLIDELKSKNRLSLVEIKGIMNSPVEK